MIPFNTVLKLERLELKIKELHEKKKKVVADLIRKYGDKTFVYELDGKKLLREDGKKFTRVKLIDNFKKLEKGETIWKSTGFSRFDMELSFLKNRPKE